MTPSSSKGSKRLNYGTGILMRSQVAMTIPGCVAQSPIHHSSSPKVTIQGEGVLFEIYYHQIMSFEKFKMRVELVSRISPENRKMTDFLPISVFRSVRSYDDIPSSDVQQEDEYEVRSLIFRTSGLQASDY